MTTSAGDLPAWRPASPTGTAASAASERLHDKDLIFLFGLPRSGTTLLQRILWQSPEIYTTPEPWLLLPLLQPMRSVGARCDFDFTQSARALEDLSIGVDEYRSAVATAALSLYGSLLADGSKGSKFLDKTPRYHLIAEEILRAFPGSRAVVVWRNPLAVAASIMTTWNRGRWNLYNYYVDLYDGAAALLSACRRFPDRLHILRYEDLVQDPIRICASLFQYLDLDFDPAMVERGTRSRLVGRMGDKKGQAEYGNVSTAGLTKFREAYSTPFRRRWARRYLDWLGQDALAEMGYAPEETYGTLVQKKVNVRLLVSDFLRYTWGATARWIDIEGLRAGRRRTKAGLPPLRYR